MTKLKVLIFLVVALLVQLPTHAEVIHSERSLYRNVIVEDKQDIRCLKFSLKRTSSSQT